MRVLPFRNPLAFPCGMYPRNTRDFNFPFSNLRSAVTTQSHDAAATCMSDHQSGDRAVWRSILTGISYASLSAGNMSIQVDGMLGPTNTNRATGVSVGIGTIANSYPGNAFSYAAIARYKHSSNSQQVYLNGASTGFYGAEFGIDTSDKLFLRVCAVGTVITSNITLTDGEVYLIAASMDVAGSKANFMSFNLHTGSFLFDQQTGAAPTGTKVGFGAGIKPFDGRIATIAYQNGIRRYEEEDFRKMAQRPWEIWYGDYMSRSMLSGYSFPPIPSAFFYLRPDADFSTGTWTPSVGSDLFAMIDETVVDDADFIRSADNPANDTTIVTLSDPTVGKRLKDPFTVRYRYKKHDTGTISITVTLRQGSTQIAQWVHSSPTTSFQTASQTITGSEYAAITDWTNLRLEFKANV